MNTTYACATDCRELWFVSPRSSFKLQSRRILHRKKRANWFALHKHVGKSHVGKVAINLLAASVNILLLFTWLRDHPHGQPVLPTMVNQCSRPASAGQIAPGLHCRLHRRALDSKRTLRKLIEIHWFYRGSFFDYTASARDSMNHPWAHHLALTTIYYFALPSNLIM